MKTREWQKLERQASLDAFILWLLECPETKRWRRKDLCACPLHDFIETVTGWDIGINSPELHEHWDERETQRWPTPWWMTWIMRSVDHVGTEPVTPDELLALTLIMIDRGFRNPLLSAEEFARAA